MIYGNWDGLNLVDPTHTLRPGELTVAQNVICTSVKLEKVPGTDEYAVDAPLRVPWVTRYYGRKPDKTRIKESFFFSNGSIYSVDTPTTGITQRLSGLTTNSRPESVLTRTGGQNWEFLFTGNEVPYYYDGNDSLDWKKSVITQTFVQGVWWLDRLWAFEDSTSTLWYSKTLEPSNFVDSTDAGFRSVAAANGGKIKAIALIGDTLYVFKDNGIYYIEGRIPSRFAVRTVFDDRGLATKRGLCFVNTALLVLSEQDKEWYEFNGTETGWKLISDKLNFSNLLSVPNIDMLSCTWHDNIFRCSYPDVRDGGIRPEREMLFPTTEVREDGQPKWSETKGANIDSYAIMDREGDNNILLTGRSDAGKVMRHGKIHEDIASRNWDETAMEIWVRTLDQIEKLGINSEFVDMNISGGVADGTINIRSYLDSRNETRGEQTIDQDGEDSASPFGLAQSVPQQARYNDYITLPMGKNIGETLALEFFDGDLDTRFELYEVNVKTRPLHRKRGKGIGA